MRLRTSLALVLFLVSGCGDHEAANPTSPSTVFDPASSGNALLQPPGLAPQTAKTGSTATGSTWPGIDLLAAFPDRREPVEFRTQLEGVYQARGAQRTSTYVDIEGTVIWTTEYIRYRLSNCSDAESVNKVAFEIANLNSPGPPECGSVAPFPDRRDAFRFRTEFLEPQYQNVLNKPLQQLFVNAEGDVIWTMEYLRYRVGNCSHAEATAKVNMDIGGAGPQPVCSGPSSPSTPPTARFSVFPNPGTNVNTPQCSVTSVPVNNGSRNQLRCTFDAGDSTPLPGITSFSWTFEGQDNQTVRSGERIQNNTLPCGSFGATGQDEVGKTVERNVRLQVTSPGGTNSIARDVTFVKATPC
jgi:hypothetical protein